MIVSNLRSTKNVRVVSELLSVLQVMLEVPGFGQVFLQWEGAAQVEQLQLCADQNIF